MSTLILSRSIVHADDADVDVTLFVLDGSGMSGPYSVTGLSSDGRRFVAVSDDTDDETVTRCVQEVARQHWTRSGWQYIPTDDNIPHASGECAHCGEPITRADEKALSGEWATVWTDPSGSWVCPETGDEHEPSHTHTYRADMATH